MVYVLGLNCTVLCKLREITVKRLREGVSEPIAEEEGKALIS